MATSTMAGTFIGATPLSGIFNSTDGQYNTTPLGTKTVGANGHDYIFVQAAGAIGDGTTTPVPIVITEAPAWTAVAGSGPFHHKGLPVSSGQRFWAERILL